MVFNDEISSSSDESSTSDSETDSDDSYCAISPITSEDEYITSESSDDSDDCESLNVTIVQESASSETATSQKCLLPKFLTHKCTVFVCGDNIDKSINSDI